MASGVRMSRALQRRPQIADTGSRGVVRIVRKDIEDVAADDVIAARHCGAQVRVADGRDGEIGAQHQIETRRSLEEGAKIRRNVVATQIHRNNANRLFNKKRLEMKPSPPTRQWWHWRHASV
jgi:hypothetical protein